jgi:hypothetical protein
MATLNTIRDRLHAQPFQPFDLVLVDGTRCTVRHPDYLSIAPVQRPRDVLYYHVFENSDEYQSRFIDLSLILEVAVPSEETFQRARPPGPPAPGATPG